MAKAIINADSRIFRNTYLLMNHETSGRVAMRTAGPEHDAPAQAIRGRTKRQVPYLPSDPLRLAYRCTRLLQFGLSGFVNTR
jgi:hypothetical protein